MKRDIDITVSLLGQKYLQQGSFKENAFRNTKKILQKNYYSQESVDICTVIL